VGACCRPQVRSRPGGSAGVAAGGVVLVGGVFVAVGGVLHAAEPNDGNGPATGASGRLRSSSPMTQPPQHTADGRRPRRRRRAPQGTDARHPQVLPPSDSTHPTVPPPPATNVPRPSRIDCHLLPFLRALAPAAGCPASCPHRSKWCSAQTARTPGGSTADGHYTGLRLAARCSPQPGRRTCGGTTFGAWPELPPAPPTDG